jgi:hypothetical protein
VLRLSLQVNGYTIKLTLNKDAKWTKALKFMLADLKAGLELGRAAFMIHRFAIVGGIFRLLATLSWHPDSHPCSMPNLPASQPAWLTKSLSHPPFLPHAMPFYD